MNAATAVLYDQRSNSSVTRCDQPVGRARRRRAASLVLRDAHGRCRARRARHTRAQEARAALDDPSVCRPSRRRPAAGRRTGGTAAARRRRRVSKYSSGATRLPFDFDILAPPMRIMPWVNSRVNGSRSVRRCDAEVGQRLGEEAGVHQVQDGVLDAADVLVDRHPVRDRVLASNGASSFHGSQKRRKYHDESTKVSIVSVSRVGGPPQLGQVVCRKPSWSRSGDSPVGRNSTSSGAQHRAAGRRARARCRGRGSRRSGSGSPRSAAATAASRAGGS